MCPYVSFTCVSQLFRIVMYYVHIRLKKKLAYRLILKIYHMQWYRTQCADHIIRIRCDTCCCLYILRTDDTVSNVLQQSIAALYN